jgi:hypothetical protein
VRTADDARLQDSPDEFPGSEAMAAIDASGHGHRAARIFREAFLVSCASFVVVPTTLRAGWRRGMGHFYDGFMGQFGGRAANLGPTTPRWSQRPPDLPAVASAALSSSSTPAPGSAMRPMPGPPNRTQSFFPLVVLPRDRTRRPAGRSRDRHSPPDARARTAARLSDKSL